MSKTVVIGASSNVRDYSFCVPLAALLWRDVVGFETFWYLIGTDQDWTVPARNKVVVQMLQRLNVGFKRLDPVEGYEVSTQAQNIRQHAAADPQWGDDEWLMMTDADLFPMKRDFYHQHEPSPAKAVCLYANGDHFVSKENLLAVARYMGEFQTLPTCHVTMRAGTWRDLYGYRGLEPMEAMRQSLDNWLKPRHQGRNPSEASWQSWMSDQRLVSEKLCGAEWFPKEVLLIDRRGHPPVDRLDRAHLKDWESLDTARWTDCHTIRPCDIDGSWQKVRPIFAKLTPGRMGLIDEYREAFKTGY